ncbi:hypothetical protein [Nostoc sp. TCL26-01]|uniref:hypothetical protein n=1 Tax=Nostoc sp. TCL26-01 TaxID=2576904 RepID=UPI0015BF28FA|nr:hypothetical protein [Nostoc sp. TCL26-01]QLE57088.1 hypothetical protein FD725_17105 [Nostoc sp. TCL26-01]
MNNHLTSTDTDNFALILSQVATAYRAKNSSRPTPEVLVNALLQAEKVAKQQQLTNNFESLIGKWRLCFATGTKKAKARGGIILGKGWYIPQFIAIHLAFSYASEQDLTRGEISNQVQWSTVTLKLTGPAKHLGKKNLLAFDFTQMLINVFGRTIYRQQIRSGKMQTEDFYTQPITKLPFFAFFIVTEDLIAARGRGGGLALWIRDSESK